MGKMHSELWPESKESKIDLDLGDSIQLPPRRQKSTIRFSYIWDIIMGKSGLDLEIPEQRMHTNTHTMSHRFQ